MKHYLLLVSDGNGAASRGTDVDHYYNIEGDAEDLNDFLKQNWDTFFGEDYDEYFEEYFEEADDDMRPEDLYKYIQTTLDIGGGDPWIEGVMENDRVINEPDVEHMLEYGCDIDYDDAEKWFDKNTIAQLNGEEEHEISVDDCIEACNGNKEAGKILYGWLENEDALYDDPDEVLSDGNILDLCDACTNHKKQLIVAHAIGADTFDDEDIEEDDDDVDESLKDLFSIK